MNAEQRAQEYQDAKVKVNETDAERRDRHMALAANRGIVIAELVQIHRDTARELDLIAAAFPEGSPTSCALLLLAERARAAIKRGIEA